MDAKYLLRCRGLRRMLTTRRWSLGTGCNQELGVQGRLEGITRRRSFRSSCRHDISGCEFTSLSCQVGGAARGATGEDRHVWLPLRSGLLLFLVLLPLLLLEALGIEWVLKLSLLQLLDLPQSRNANPLLTEVLLATFI